MNGISKKVTLVGVVLLCAFLSYSFLQVIPDSVNAGGPWSGGPVASPVGNAHSGGTAWLHDPVGGSIGIPGSTD